MENALAFDVESSGATNDTYGNPFSNDNRLCCISYAAGERLDSGVLPIEYEHRPYGEYLSKFDSLVTDSSLLIGFNIKFDLHWIKRYGIDFRGKNLWDCQLAYYIMNNQFRDPSLAHVSRQYGEEKLDVVKTEYWEKGIDTPDIPWDILYEYALHDAEITWKIYQEQQRELRNLPKMRKLIWMSCQDLAVTQEMEWNGLHYNMGKSLSLSRETRLEIDKITEELNTYSPVELNWDSNDHVSALLYGGIVKKKERIQVPFTYKDGRTVMKEKWGEVEYKLERQVEPLKGTETKKAGYFEVNEDTLRNLKANGKQRKFLELFMKRNELMKLTGTYYEGIPELYKEMGWEGEVIHGSLNHSRAATGRLTCTKPNQQNMGEGVLQCIETRFSPKEN